MGQPGLQCLDIAGNFNVDDWSRNEIDVVEKRCELEEEYATQLMMPVCSLSLDHWYSKMLRKDVNSLIKRHVHPKIIDASKL